MAGKCKASWENNFPPRYEETSESSTSDSSLVPDLTAQMNVYIFHIVDVDINLLVFF